MGELKTRVRQFFCPHDRALLVAWEGIDRDDRLTFIKAYFECEDCGYITVREFGDPKPVESWKAALKHYKKISKYVEGLWRDEKIEEDP